MTGPVRIRDGLEARLEEIDAALARDRDVRIKLLDWAELLFERKDIHERLYPETRHGGDRKSVDFQDQNQVDKLSIRFSAAVAALTGQSYKSVERAIFIAAHIPAALKARLRGTRFADHGSELKALAALRDPALQTDVVDLALAPGAEMTLRDAIARLTGSDGPEDPDDARWTRLTASWTRAPARVKAMFIAALIETGELDELLAQARTARA